MSVVKEFREFISRGNVLDLAVGVIIGAAFGKIVASLVDDIIMPPIGKVIGGVDFSDLFIPLDETTAGAKTLAEAKKLGAVIAYGQFLNVLINFLIVAFAIFLVVKIANNLRRKKEAEVAPSVELTREEVLLTEIRDLLQANNSNGSVVTGSVIKTN